jgi:hypothetical protein
MNPFFATLILSLRAAHRPRRFANVKEWSLATLLLREMGRQFEISDIYPFYAIILLYIHPRPAVYIGLGTGKSDP